jgi:hypothetical protein
VEDWLYGLLDLQNNDALLVGAYLFSFVRSRHMHTWERAKSVKFKSILNLMISIPTLILFGG